MKSTTLWQSILWKVQQNGNEYHACSKLNLSLGNHCTCCFYQNICEMLPSKKNFIEISLIPIYAHCVFD